jgi:SAM-dependent methyltransferase
MDEFYTRFYQAVETSSANAAFCEAVYGRNLCQHGFADMAHLDEIILRTGMSPATQVLDLGCGNGMIAEYFSDSTGAHVTGIDNIPCAIERALSRTRAGHGRLDFAVMDMGSLTFPPASFDVIISIDTLYFTDLRSTLTGLLTLLKPGGTLAVIYDCSAMPHDDLQSYDRRTNLPQYNPLGLLLDDLGLRWQSRELNAEVLAHVRRRLAILPSLEQQYITEGNQFLYESHLAEARGMERAYSNHAGGRHLYLIQQEAQSTSPESA